MSRRILGPRSSRSAGLLGVTLGGLVLGVVAGWRGAGEVATLFWSLPAAVMGLRLAIAITRDLLARRAGVDLIALLAIVGALALGEPFAAAVIGLMLATGESLEAYAEGRARRDLSLLLGRAPQVAHRRRDDVLEDVPLEAIAPGDRLLVRPGEVVPVDGRVLSEAAAVDESALTGESGIVVRPQGDLVASGVVNAGGPLELRAVATAAESTYAGILRLVEEAGRSKAPFVRLADRYALAFVPLTLGLAAVAGLVSGAPERALAVLVVATPCPLILAAPIAIVAGISRAARRGVIVKGGGPLETLARARLLLLDKTGTLTLGRPRVAGVERPGGDPQELLRLAAGLEQASSHVLAAAIVQAARDAGLPLSIPTDVTEIPGAGIRGRVDGRRVAIGSAEFVASGRPLPSWAREIRRRTWLEGATPIFVALDDEVVGAIVLDDPLRPEAPRALRTLRRTGFSRIVMVTGDHVGVADLVGAAVGVDAVLAERSPADKVEAVAAERELGEGPLVMVGDGINDAPALAAADVGVAMGARGATASSEAADVVITVDRLDRLAEAVAIARRARSIAVQSVVAGMGLSLVAMVAAAAGWIPVVGGAILQEGIDVVAILNALRALTGGTLRRPIRVPGWRERRAGLLDAHRRMAPALAQLRQLADVLDGLEPGEARRRLEAVRDFLVGTVVPHEVEEDRVVYPQLAAALENEDATAALHHTHVEIFHLARLFARAVADLDPEGPTAEDWPDLRRLLYGLDAILRLHWAQEEELYGSLAEDDEVRLAAQAA